MLLDAILTVANGTFTVTRRAVGTIVDGEYVINPTTTTLQITASIQPARGLPRVTGGRDMLQTEYNQHTVEALVMYTTSEVFERTPTNDPDEIRYNGRDYVISRSERWDAFGEVFWVAVLDLKTGGAS